MSDPTKVNRRLAAVFAADVEGYSRLMGADEVGTLKGLTERRAILDRFIGDHGGRIANTAGDSVLAEFGSDALWMRRLPWSQRTPVYHQTSASPSASAFTLAM
jgi:hypothetical protein